MDRYGEFERASSIKEAFGLGEFGRTLKICGEFGRVWNKLKMPGKVWKRLIEFWSF